MLINMRIYGFQRLVEYCRSDYKMRDFNPTTIPIKFYLEQFDYSLTSYENYYSLNQIYATQEQLLNPDDVLEENCHVLERL